jgi:hypothetical protein
MKNGKPKGPVPSLIGSTLGKPRRVPVEKKSTCKRCGAPILAGQNCVAIPQLGGSFSNLKRYCEECFKAILEKTKADLDQLITL